MKMGHGGTLDPMATGVLIVGVGSGTKKLNQFLGGWKEYETTCVFGTVTDSYDAEGKILRRTPTEHITQVAVEKALEDFKGDIEQQPPMYVRFRRLN
jgi:tRNA pseudouridine55 synthase